jgi:hypothetical protein
MDRGLKLWRLVMVELYYLVVGYVFYFELFLKKTNEIFKP